MTRRNTRIALVLTGVLATVLTTILDLQFVSAEGGARRDAVRQEQLVKAALTHAMEAVEYGKQSHAENLVTHAEAAMQQAIRGGTGAHVTEAIASLKEAIEQGKAGHTDTARKYAETAVTHLSQVK